MSAYAVVIEGAEGAYSAYAPDLPGCVVTGASIEEVTGLMREAIELHIESLRSHGEEVPKPTTAVRLVEVA